MKKYIDADRLLANIKEIENEFKTGNYYLDNSEQAIGYSAALDDIEKFLDTLSEEPDKSLEEAAEKYSDKYCSDWAYRLEYEDAFIAGAEWMAKQEE